MSGISIGLGIGLKYNKPILGKIKPSIPPVAVPSPIASYECYDYTNESEGKEVLRDLTGNGHDIQLYNFAFAENSGYGKYVFDFRDWINDMTGDSGTVSVEKFSNKFVWTDLADRKNNIAYVYLTNTNITPEFRVEITNKPCTIYYNIIAYYEESEESNVLARNIILNEGINFIASYNAEKEGLNVSKILITFSTPWNESAGVLENPFIIEQIPDYKGALVSDGVDDYGLCENFPIFTKEKGYTVCAIRKWLDITKLNFSKVFLSKRVYSSIEDPVQYGAFTLDKIPPVSHNYMISINNYGTSNFSNDIDKNINNAFTVLTSSHWNGLDISKGNHEDTSILNLFMGYWNALYNVPAGEYSSIALYALKIFGRDLTDEEIAYEKKKMIQRYEEKTGETYVEEVTA